MTIVEDMSTTMNPPQHKGLRENDQEKFHYADLRIMPILNWIPLQDRGFVLPRSA